MATHAPTTIPPSLRAGIMARAWAMFRTNYNYPFTPFRSIGRACFASCVKAAWAEAREIVRLAGFGVAALREAITRDSKPRERIGISTNFWEPADEMCRRFRALRLYQEALLIAGGAQ